MELNEAFKKLGIDSPNTEEYHPIDIIVTTALKWKHALITSNKTVKRRNETLTQLREERDNMKSEIKALTIINESLKSLLENSSDILKTAVEGWAYASQLEFILIEAGLPVPPQPKKDK